MIIAIFWQRGLNIIKLLRWNGSNLRSEIVFHNFEKKKTKKENRSSKTEQRITCNNLLTRSQLSPETIFFSERILFFFRTCILFGYRLDIKITSSLPHGGDVNIDHNQNSSSIGIRYSIYQTSHDVRLLCFFCTLIFIVKQFLKFNVS